MLRMPGRNNLSSSSFRDRLSSLTIPLDRSTSKGFHNCGFSDATRLEQNVERARNLMAKSLPAVEAADETRHVVEFVGDSWTLKRIFRIYEIDILSCRGWEDGREGNRKVSVK